ncbi:MAG: hypothetical protein ABI672_08710 [Vicinamibacteria bacterium]
MTLQTAPAQGPVQASITPSTSSSVAPSATPIFSATPVPTPIPTPSLRPGETITWVRLERPKLALGSILASSFAIVGLVIALALGLGTLIGYVRSKGKRATTHGAGGLGLR